MGSFLGEVWAAMLKGETADTQAGEKPEAWWGALAFSPVCGREERWASLWGVQAWGGGGIRIPGWQSSSEAGSPGCKLGWAQRPCGLALWVT